MVQQQFELDPFTNTLFLLCGRRRNRIKGLYWERDEFILLHKRLEQGAYQWPRPENEVKKRIESCQPKAHREVTGLSMIWDLFKKGRDCAQATKWRWRQDKRRLQKCLKLFGIHHYPQ